MNGLTTDKITFWLLIAFLLVFIEAAIFGNGTIVFVLLGAGLIYFGMKKRSRAMFWAGTIFIAIALFSLWSLRLLILAVVVYILSKLWKGVPADQIIRPLREQPSETLNGIKRNKLFALQSNSFGTYEWEDIHVQGFLGDMHIDVTNTVLPKGASFISVRQGFGRIRIEVPYEIPVRIHYSTFFGEAKLFGVHRNRLLNESLQMKDGYSTGTVPSTELIISLSTWFGDVEVVRK